MSNIIKTIKDSGYKESAYHDNVLVKNGKSVKLDGPWVKFPDTGVSLLRPSEDSVKKRL